ncbi:MAG: hypothetical protein EBS69_09840 [Verrucomicrobia bacterium]|nr:hypothetical protein [Verrucomicrobiota bacterium]
MPRDLTKRKSAPESKGFVLDENRAKIGKFEVVVVSTCVIAPPSYQFLRQLGNPLLKKARR